VRESGVYCELHPHDVDADFVRAFNPRGVILSGSHDNTVKVWETDTGRTLKTFRGHSSWVEACAFSPDRKTVVSAGHDHRARAQPLEART
jgi:WD40 repeat protein